jgi:hypothetical protein
MGSALGREETCSLRASCIGKLTFRRAGRSGYAASVDTATCAAAAAGLVLTPTLVATYLRSDLAAATAPLASIREGCELYRQQFVGLTPEASEALPAAGRQMLHTVVATGVPVLAGSDAPAFCSSARSALIVELGLLRDGGLSPLGVSSRRRCCLGVYLEAWLRPGASGSTGIPISSCLTATPCLCASNRAL